MEPSRMDVARVGHLAPGSGAELRYYPSAMKLLLLLLGAGVFVTAGALMVASTRNDPIRTVIGYIAIGFFGLGVLVFLALLAGRVVHRRAWLTVNSAGIASDAYGRRRFVPWDQMRDIAIYRQVASRSSQYYLVVHLRDGVPMPAGFSSRLNAALYSSLAQAGMIVPLNMLFVRCTRARRARLLEQIASRFGSQLGAYGIALDPRERLLR